MSSTEAQLDTRLVAHALDELARAIKVELDGSAESHLVLHAHGVESSDAVDALATYLIACLAGAVRVDISLAARIWSSTPDPKEHLRQRVIEHLLASEHAEHVESWYATRRNPWIAEGLAHALLCVANRQEIGCIAGRAIAVKPLHSQVSQTGLDLIGIYESNDTAQQPFLAVGESKASKENPSGELSRACGFFGKVERGERDGDLTADLLMFEPHLDDTTLDNLGPTLWADRRTYLPLIAHGSSFDARERRPALESLRPPREHKRVLLVSLPDFDGYFSAVAAAALRKFDEICR